MTILPILLYLYFTDILLRAERKPNCESDSLIVLVRIYGNSHLNVSLFNSLPKNDNRLTLIGFSLNSHNAHTYTHIYFY